MLLKSMHPIMIFDLEDCGINPAQYIKYMKPYFYQLEWDWYLYRQQKLEFLIQNCFSSGFPGELSNLFSAYYMGEAGEESLKAFEKLFNSSQVEAFKKISMTRRRAMQAYKIYNTDSGISITEENGQNFIQKEGLVSKEKTDWRKIERLFQKPPTEMITEDLKIIIKNITKKIMKYHKEIKEIDLYVHFTQIVAQGNHIVSNSPEGIHQDGMDYIVSALVMDRENTLDGKTILYEQKNNTRKEILEITLKEGWGLLQPDKNTNLWHIVEPITQIDRSKPAYRSTIGFDFNFPTIS